MPQSYMAPMTSSPYQGGMRCPMATPHQPLPPPASGGKQAPATCAFRCKAAFVYRPVTKSTHGNAPAINMTSLLQPLTSTSYTWRLPSSDASLTHLGFIGNTHERRQILPLHPKVLMPKGDNRQGASSWDAERKTPITPEQITTYCRNVSMIYRICVWINYSYTCFLIYFSSKCHLEV